MKIAMLTNNYRPFVGGVPVSVERQAQELVKLGHQVTVFAPTYESDNPEEAESFQEKILEADARSPERVIRYCSQKKKMDNGMVYPGIYPAEIIETFEREKFDCIHVHHPMFVGPWGQMVSALKDYGMDDVTVYIGCRLSYPDEKIVWGHPGELTGSEADGLCAAMILNPRPDRRTGPHIPDEEFIRGKVPMTKAEVRAVSLAQMELTENAVVYDVGAGTGSVSVEAALSGDRIRVYAIEKKTEAVRLLEENRKKFRTDGIRIIEGEAPAVLRELEPPTHVFIGGSSGNLREILRVVLEKNPSVRIVVNAISLETVGEAMAAIEEGLLKDAQVTQIMASRSRVLGRYHMMTGQNPVYIISAGGEMRDDAGEKPEERSAAK